MKIFELHRTQTIPRPRAEVFAFFQDPQNLARITPPSLGFKILTPSPIRMAKGTLIDYVVHVVGVPVRWTSLITEYDPPDHFVDVQINGPYAYWHHTHRFKESPKGTIIEDHVRYGLPFGVLGAWTEPFFVRRQLNAIFQHRQRVIENVFKSSGG